MNTAASVHWMKKTASHSSTTNRATYAKLREPYTHRFVAWA